MNDDAYKNLALAVVNQAVNDYKTIARADNRVLHDMSNTIMGGAYIIKHKNHLSIMSEIESLERWFKSDTCDLYLQDVISRDELVRQLRLYKKANRETLY